MYVLSRYVDNIVLNPKEYVLDSKDEVITFKTKQNALDYINKFADDPIQNEEELEEEFGMFIDEDGEE